MPEQELLPRMADVAQACWEAIDDAYPGERAILVGCSIGSSMLIWMHNHRSPQTAALIMCGTGYNPNKEFIPPRIEAYKERGMGYRWGYTFEDFSPAFRSTPMAHFFADLFADRNVFGDVDTIITQFQAYQQPEPEGHHAKVVCPAIIITGSNLTRTVIMAPSFLSGTACWEHLRNLMQNKSAMVLTDIIPTKRMKISLH